MPGAPLTNPANAAPVVAAGDDQAITLPNPASLTGTLVSDDAVPAGATVAWSTISGPGTVTFGDATQASTTASFSDAGTYVLRLTATDGELSAFDETSVLVSPAGAVNQAPSVDAGGDQTIALPAFATLDATVTDDGLPVPPGLTTTNWSLFDGPASVTFGDAHAEDTTATFDAPGTYILRMTAYDGEYTITDDVTVTVQAEGQSALDFSGVDAYVTFGNPAKLHLPTFTVEAWFRRDGNGLTTTTGTSGITAAIPLVSRGRGEAENPAVDLNYFLGIDDATDVLAADFEEGALGSSPSLNHPVLGVTPITAGVWHHAAATYDGSKWQLFLDGQLEAELVVNEPPADAGNQHAAIGSALTSTGVAAGFFDGAVDEVRIWDRALTLAEIRANLNMPLTTAPNLVARWGLNEGAGTTVFDSIATPATGTIQGTGYAWTAGAPFDLNLPPEVSDPGDQSGTEGAVISLQIVATDPDPLHVITFAATGLPPGLSIDTATGEISGTIDVGAAAGSPYAVVVTATDNGSPAQSGQTDFNWAVETVNQEPAVTHPGDQTTAEGAAVSLQIAASDPDAGQTLGYSATGLPAGLSIGATSGLISGTVALGASGGSPYTVTVTVTDNGSPAEAADVVFTWTIGAPGTNFALDFDGVDDHVSFASSSALGLATFTLEAWIQRQGAGVGTTTGTSGLPNAVPIVSKGTSEVDQSDARDMNYFLGIDASTGVLVADFEESAAGANPSLNHPISGVTAIPMGTWTHVAATYDGTTWRLYVNGALDQSLTVGQPPRSDSIQPFGIGTAFESDLSPEGFFAGLIDEVRVWNHARYRRRDSRRAPAAADNRHRPCRPMGL